MNAWLRIACLVLAIGAAPAFANIAAGDREFVKRAAEDGTAQVELSRLAQGRASAEPVKRFAARMLDDHGRASSQLASLARAKGVHLSDKQGGQHRATHERLERLSGPEFDRHFMEQIVTEHKKGVAEYEKAAGNLEDAELKTFATRTLGTLREHLKLAQATHDELKRKSGGTTPGATSNTGGSASGSVPSTETKPSR